MNLDNYKAVQVAAVKSKKTGLFAISSTDLKEMVKVCNAYNSTLKEPEYIVTYFTVWMKQKVYKINSLE